MRKITYVDLTMTEGVPSPRAEVWFDRERQEADVRTADRDGGSENPVAQP